jgi:signal transduction histidine kinase/CheY-like chemotaxis protein
MDYSDTCNLAETEQAKLLARYAAGIIRLEQDILAAQASNSLKEQGIANERAGDFYLEWGKEKIAAIYMQDAHNCYIQSAEQDRAHSLKEHYPQLLQSTLPPPQSAEINYFTDEFIATISHEFRNPLNGILGMAETLLEEVFGTMNAQQLNAVSTIDRSGWYLLALINSMVDLSQIQVGKLELEISNISVAELCHSSTTFVQHHAIQKNIQLDTEIPTNAGYIAVDVQRMRQVLINLISQAIDATPAGGSVKLVVTIQQQESSSSTIQFAVIDSSKEISSQLRPELEQFPISTNNRKIGFGLMLVHPIIELHGGTLSFQSDIGRGSSVRISLPYTCLTTDSTITQSSFATDFGAKTICQEIPTPPLILIVEDNELNINTIASYITAKGYRPIVAQDGQAAIELTQKYHPDIILMDIQMPGMDGLEAIGRIRQQSSAIPIIALTALAMEGDRALCLAAGANEYLAKPVKLKQLHDTIQQLLEEKMVQDKVAEDAGI